MMLKSKKLASLLKTNALHYPNKNNNYVPELVTVSRLTIALLAQTLSLAQTIMVLTNNTLPPPRFFISSLPPPQLDMHFHQLHEPSKI